MAVGSTGALNISGNPEHTAPMSPSTKSAPVEDTGVGCGAGDLSPSAYVLSCSSNTPRSL